MNKTFYCSVLLMSLLLFSIQCFSQSNKQTTDSLLKVLNTKKTDTVRLNLYSKLCNVCDINDNLTYAEPALKLADSILSYVKNDQERTKILKEKASFYNCILAYYETTEGYTSPKLLYYHKKMMEIYRQIGDKKGIAYMIYSIGYDYAREGDVIKQLEYYQQSMDSLKKMNYKRGMLNLLSAIAKIYITNGDTARAIQQMKMSISVAKELKDTNAIGHSLTNMGILYNRAHLIPKALSYFRQAISLFGDKKNKDAIGTIYYYLGEVYLGQGNIDTALSYYYKFLPIARQETNHYMLARVLRSITWANVKQGNISQAFNYCKQAVNIAQQSNYNIEIGRSYSLLAGIYLKQKKYKLAKHYCSLMASIMKQNGDIAAMSTAEKLFTQIDSASDNYKDAYMHYQKYIIYRDKFKNEELHRALVKEKFQNEYQKKIAANKAQLEKKEAAAKAEKQRQRILLYAGGIVLLLVILFSLFILRAYNHKQKANVLLADKNKIIEEKNRDITDSITYAKRIQQASLPKQDEILNVFPESFILFKPKDIVSGDFYFLYQKEQEVYVAAADCTGHGVPGAFMSILGSEKLNLVVRQFHNPSDILLNLNNEIKKALHQSEMEEATRDGLDIALCSVDIANKLMQFSSANRPLWIIRQGSNEIEEIKGTKKAIGGFTEDNQHYDTHKIQLHEGDSFYIFSDGYADTFGKDNSKKLTSKKFKTLLLSIKDKTMQEQGQHLDSFIEEWKGDIEQIDDILVIGVRV